MKKLFGATVMLMLCFLLKGQDIKSDSIKFTNPVPIRQALSSDSTKFSYCEIVGTAKLFSKKVTIEMDFGQLQKYWSDNRYKDPATGAPIVFNSMMDALNFMGKDGWEFVQAYIIGDAQSGYVYHFLLKKETSLIEKEK